MSNSLNSLSLNKRLSLFLYLLPLNEIPTKNNQKSEKSEKITALSVCNTCSFFRLRASSDNLHLPWSEKWEIIPPYGWKHRTMTHLQTVKLLNQWSFNIISFITLLNPRYASDKHNYTKACLSCKSQYLYQLEAMAQLNISARADGILAPCQVSLLPPLTERRLFGEHVYVYFP